MTIETLRAYYTNDLKLSEAATDMLLEAMTQLADLRTGRGGILAAGIGEFKGGDNDAARPKVGGMVDKAIMKATRRALQAASVPPAYIDAALNAMRCEADTIRAAREAVKR